MQGKFWFVGHRRSPAGTMAALAFVRSATRVFGALLFLLSASALAATVTWTGAGADARWSTAANWGGVAPGAGDALVFPAGAMPKVTTNDLPGGTLLASIEIADSAYTFSGNPIRLGTGISTTYASGVVSFPLPTTLPGTAPFVIAPGGTLVLAGVLADGAGTASLTKHGGGTLELTAANTYTGMTTVADGTLRLNHGGGAALAGNLTVGDGSGAAATAVARLLVGSQLPADAVVTVKGDGVFDLNGFDQTVAALELNAGGVTTGAGTLTLTDEEPNPAVTATSASVAGTSKAATIAGTLRLGTAFGSTHRFDVNPGTSAIDLDVSATITGESLSMQGVGTLQLGGSAADNSFRYLFAVNGLVLLAKTGGHVAVRELSVGQQSGSSVAGRVRLLASNQLDPTRLLHVWVGGLLDLNGFDQAVADVSFAGGGITTGAGTLTISESVMTSVFMQETATIEGNLNLGGAAVGFLITDALTPGEPEIIVDGVISNGGIVQDIGPAGLVAGKLELRGANTYTGTTSVLQGSLVVNGSTESNTELAKDTRLEGTGRITGSVQSTGGTIAPGSSPGILHVGPVALDSASTLAIEMAGVAVGTQYSQLDVTGNVSLGGAALNVSLGFVPRGGDAFTIIRNDGSDGVVGTFAGLAEGATLTIDGVNFAITYRGGDGNDVVLTAKTEPTPVPAPVPALGPFALLLLSLLVGGLAWRRSTTKSVYKAVGR